MRNMRNMEDNSCITDAITGRAVCPLQNVEIRAAVEKTSAEVTVIQNYVNCSGSSIEALYMFPLPHHAQVTGFVCKIGENEVTGEFREKDEAFAEYDRAVRNGDNAFLLENHRPGIFQISLGNIAPGEKASVRISYLEDVRVVDNELRWAIPTVIAPRYIPGNKSGNKKGIGTTSPTDKVPDADYITPPVADTAYTLKITAVFSGLPGLSKISSPSHPIAVQMNGQAATVTLARETELLDSDFVISALLVDEGSDSFIIAGGQEELFGSVSFMPDISDTCSHKSDMDLFSTDNSSYSGTGARAAHHEYVFLIDVSGSMGGEKLDQAKRALSISLRNLLEGDRFNIIAFESRFKCFSRDAVPYSQHNLDKADVWISQLCEMGGTEIYDPLSFALESPAEVKSMDRIVLLFTDGQVGNERDIVSLIRSHSSGLQLYPFGIDTAVNRFFIDSMADAGNGMPEYIYPGERIEDKVIRQFSRIHQPFMSNPKVVAGDGSEIAAVPKLPSRIYSSETYSFTFRAENKCVLEEIKICGRVDGKDAGFMLKADVSVSANARLLGLKWAKGRIEELESQSRGSYQRRNDLLKQEIVQLSRRYAVMSAHTSLVAVHRRIVKATGIPETIIVPVEKPRGWNMFNEPEGILFSASAPYIADESNRAISAYESCDSLPTPGFLRSRRAGSGRAASHNRSGKLPEDGADKPLDFCSSVPDKDLLRTGKIMIENSSGNSASGGKATGGKASAGKATGLDEVIRAAAQSQNADGSFGAGSEAGLRTSYFIIGMLLLDKMWRPYRIQIVKAGEALMKPSNDTDSVNGEESGTATGISGGSAALLSRAAAYAMMSKSGLFNEGRVNAANASVLAILSAGQRQIYDAFISGNLRAFSDFAGLRQPDIAQPVENLPVYGQNSSPQKNDEISRDLTVNKSMLASWMLRKASERA